MRQTTKNGNFTRKILANAMNLMRSLQGLFDTNLLFHTFIEFIYIQQKGVPNGNIQFKQSTSTIRTTCLARFRSALPLTFFQTAPDQLEVY